MTAKLVFLQSDEDFDQFRRSKLITSPNLRVRVRFNTNQNTPRFGFIIPKKVLPKVTDRNKVKRRLKNFLGKNIVKMAAADYLFFPGKTSLKQKYQDLEQEIITLFKQARLWKS
jgi:ribonuclease P protein component